MPLVLLAHVVIAAIAGVSTRWLRRRSLWLVAVGPLLVLGWLASRPGVLLRGETVTSTVSWIPELGVELGLRVDGLSALFLLLIGGVGVAVCLYASRYLSPTMPGLGRLAATLALFAGAMVGLVTADDMFLLYAFWEATSITSYGLIASHDVRREAREAAQQALLITGAGGLAMLGGFVLLAQAAGTSSLSAVLADLPSGPTTGVAVALVLLGALTKSAQVPFHGWLPGAMSAPTPISAYLHAATMVKAGVYLLARFGPAVAPAVDWWSPVVVVIGLVTLVSGAWRALHQRDLKLLLAHGTVSQLGLMVALVGTGVDLLVEAGLLLVVAHALYKSALFLTVGAIDHESGTRDLTRLTDVARVMPATATAATVAAISMAGVPPLLGFVAKDEVLVAWLEAAPAGLGVAAVVATVVGSALTVAYAARFVVSGLGVGPRRFAVPNGPDVLRPDHEAGLGLIVAPAVFAGLSVVLGVVPGLLDGLLGTAASAVLADTVELDLALWHGLTPALALSALVIGVGAALAAAPRRVEAVQQVTAGLPDPGEVFRDLVAGVIRGASAVTRVLQAGSLPTYLAVIAVTALVLPLGGVLVGGGSLPLPDVTAGPGLLLPTALVIVGAAVAMAVVRHRMTGVLLLGMVGVGMAVLFALHGAPDLALTQLAVEVLTVLLFVLVLGRLPTHYRRNRTGRRLTRAVQLAIAGGVGVGVAALLAVATAATQGTPISDEHLARALPEAGGRNVVNTILVDFRALDTLGEITVLTVAALGVLGLVVARAPQPRRPAGLRRPDLEPTVVVSTGLRLVVPLALLYSLYLLAIGHDAPGGGFVGGLVAASAYVLRWVESGSDGLDRALPVRATTLLALGLGTAVLTALASVLWGGVLLEAASAKVTLPVLGELSLGSYVVFDIGVYLVVVGFVGTVLSALGVDEPAAPSDADDELPVDETEVLA